MNHQKIEEFLDEIEIEVRQAKRSYKLARSDQRFAPQIDNMTSSLARIGTCQRAVLRLMGIDPTK